LIEFVLPYMPTQVLWIKILSCLCVDKILSIIRTYTYYLLFFYCILYEK